MFTVKAITKIPQVDLYISDNFVGDGLFLNDDGTNYTLCMVEGMTVFQMPIPREYVVKHKQKIGESGIDLLQKQLAELNFAVRELKSDTAIILDEQSDMTWQNQVTALLQNHGKQDNGVDLAGLTKLIAVAQKPDLLKGK